VRAFHDPVLNAFLARPGPALRTFDEGLARGLDRRQARGSAQTENRRIEIAIFDDGDDGWNRNVELDMEEMIVQPRPGEAAFEQPGDLRLVERQALNCKPIAPQNRESIALDRLIKAPEDGAVAVRAAGKPRRYRGSDRGLGLADAAIRDVDETARNESGAAIDQRCSFDP